MVNGMNVGLILDFGTHVDGAWVYKDPAQCTLAQMAREVLAWDLVSFDAWLYGPGHWRSYPKVRQHLMGLREQLTHAYFAHAGNESEQGQRIRDYFRETRRLALRMENLPAPLRSAMVDKKTTRRGMNRLAIITLSYHIPNKFDLAQMPFSKSHVHSL